MRTEKMDVWVPENSPVWAASNMVQVTVTRGKLDSFDWAILLNSVREALTDVRGSRSKLIECGERGGEFLSVPVTTRVFMLTNPVLTRDAVKRLRTYLESLSDGNMSLMFGTSVEL